METFKASVQYNDLKGSSAADVVTSEYISKWLEKERHIVKGEYVVGIRMDIGENQGKHTDPVNVEFLVSGCGGYKDIPEMLKASGDPIKVKVIKLDMNIADFLALFKRFEITLSIDGLIEGKTYTKK